MLTIALTSIPPRFGSLGPVLESLLTQSVPSRVVLSVPKRYRRFANTPLPELPEGIEVIRTVRDYGPATKLSGVLNDPRARDILYCDDDCLYAPQWAEMILDARQSETEAVAAAPFPVSRLKRRADAPFDQIAQGFGGVLVRSEMFGESVFDLPIAAFAADDIWLSGLLAHGGTSIRAAPKARALCQPLRMDGPSLQTDVVNGLSRADANQACADALATRFGVWPPISENSV
jgi:hypothetical protein